MANSPQLGGVMDAFILPARCDRATVQMLHPELAALVGPKHIVIDASEVTMAGQALLQLLVSARRTGQGVTITPSAALSEAARIMGLTSELFGEGIYDQ